MTPHSTDRAHTISPLDIFGPAGHSSAPTPQPARAFQAVLNHVTPPAKAASHRQPVEQDSAEQPQRDPEARAENSSEKASAPAGKKQPVRTGQPNRPQHKAADPEPSDEPAQNQIASPPTSDSSQTSPQLPDAQDDQSVAAEDGAQTADPASEQVLGEQADAAQPMVAITDQPAGPPVQPIAAPEPQPDAVAVPSDEKPQAVNKPALNGNEPGLSVEATQPPGGLAAGVHENGTLSPAEPGQDSSPAADPSALIDGQTAAVEIQPAEPSGNGGEKKKGDSTENDGPPQNVADTPTPALPGPGVLTSQEAQNAAAVPPPTTNAPSSPKEASQPQPDASQPTAGVQPSPSRLPQHVLTRSEAHRGHNPAPVPVDSARFLSRVAKAFISAQQRDGEVRLRLSPPELGSLRLQVSVQDGVMVARMETETEAARSSLVNNLPTLRERLAEQGIRVERFDIDLMQRPSTGTPDRPSDPQQQQEPQPLRLLRTQQAISESPAPTTLHDHWNGNGRLNVII